MSVRGGGDEIMSRFDQSTTQAELKSKVMRRMPQLSFGKVTYVREQRLKLTNSNEKNCVPDFMPGWVRRPGGEALQFVRAIYVRFLCSQSGHEIARKTQYIRSQSDSRRPRRKLIQICTRKFLRIRTPQSPGINKLCLFTSGFTM